MFDVRLLSFLIRGLNVNVRTPVCTHLRQNLPRCDLSVHTEHPRKRPPSANSPQATGGPGNNRSRGRPPLWWKGWIGSESGEDRVCQYEAVSGVRVPIKNKNTNYEP